LLEMHRTQVFQESQSLGTRIAINLWYRDSFIEKVFPHVHIRVVLIGKPLILKWTPHYYQASLAIGDPVENALRTVSVKLLPKERTAKLGIFPDQPFRCAFRKTSWPWQN
jgi:hypothetical protein